MSTRTYYTVRDIVWDRDPERLHHTEKVIKFSKPTTDAPDEEVIADYLNSTNCWCVTSFTYTKVVRKERPPRVTNAALAIMLLNHADWYEEYAGNVDEGARREADAIREAAKRLSSI